MIGFRKKVFLQQSDIHKMLLVWHVECKPSVFGFLVVTSGATWLVRAELGNLIDEEAAL